MADEIKISGLPSATTTTGADYVPIVQGGITKKAPLNVLGTGAGIDAVSDIGLQAYWNMDSVPEIPDDPAGVTYVNSEWADITGWTAVLAGNSIAAVNGHLRTTVGGSETGAYLYKAGAHGTLKTIKLRFRSSKAGSFLLAGTVDSVDNVSIAVKTFLANEYISVDTYIAGDLGNFYIVQSGLSAGDWIEFDWAYIGTGAYLPNSLIDNSGNGNHGTIYGATPVEGISGKALAFDGVNDYCKAELSGLTTKLCLNLYLSDIVYDGGIILESSPNFNGYDGAIILYANTTQNSVVCTYHGSGGVGGAYLGGVIAVPSGGFTLSIEIDTSITTTDAMKAFVNGIQVAISFVNTSTNRVPLYNGDLYMGSRNGTSVFFTGTIDEPRIYNRALSAEEVYSLYMSKGRGPDAQVKSVRGVANSLVVRNASGQLQDMADYGIGVDTPVAMVSNANNYVKGGIYTCAAASSITNAPFASSASQILVMPYNSSYITQIATFAGGSDVPSQRIRINYGGTWGPWKEIWNSYSDGNGGQPPAAKPHLTGSIYSTTQPGFEWVGDMAVSDSISLSSGGTWLVQGIDRPTTFACSSPAITGQVSAIVNGGATITSEVTGRFRALKLT